ncbi:MAG: type II secretion system protein GspL [Gammaproteobacteria bacterium]|nr:type II secretion system protein GspL [Gammaproteobacteria bacterium]
MAQSRICLRLGMAPEASLCWWDNEKSLQICGSPDELARVAAGESVVILAPSGALLTLTAPMPAMPNQRLRQALPYALEEQFAGDVEKLHIAHGPRTAQGEVPVVAVESKVLQQWLALCEQAQIRPSGLYHEALSLPWQAGQWSLLLEPDGGVLRTGEHSGYALNAEQWPQLLAMGWEQRDAATVQTLRVYDASAGNAAEALPELPGATIEYERCEQPLQLLCEGSDENPLDLLQGPYSRREKMGRLWAPWRATAGLLAVLLGLWLVVAVYDYIRLSGQDEALYQQSVELFRDTFPEVKNVANPRVQMERRLVALQQGGAVNDFTVLLGSAGEALSASEGVNLKGLRYRQGQLELELELESLPRLDNIRAALEARSVTVEVRSASARGDKVEATILLSGADA